MAADPRETRIATALTDNVLHVVFQPVVDLRTGRTVGAEALARFKSDPIRPPDVWFGEAWEIGRGLELELMAIERALARLDEIPSRTYLALNVAPETLLAPAFMETVDPFAVDRLVVELTEHARVTDYDLMHTAIAELRARGARLAIDDAGAGFASFQHILRLRPDIIKLDRSLTAGVDRNPVRFALASALVTFAGSLGARICAEGIETSGELVALQELGIAFGQGYYLGRPSLLPLPEPPTGVWFHAPPHSSPPMSAEFEVAAPHVSSPAVRATSRIAALYETNLMDSDTEEDFDRFTRLVSRLLDSPVALLSLVDDHRQFFKSAIGLAEPWTTRRGTPLAHFLCNEAVTSKLPLVIDDARTHSLVLENHPALESGVVAYAGVPLVTVEGHVLGTLCAIDSLPRKWTEQDLAILLEIASMAIAQIELRMSLYEHREREALFQNVFDQMNVGALLCNIRGQVVYVNTPLASRLGYTNEELRGRQVSDIKHPDDVVRDFTLRDELLSGGRDEWTVETRYLCKDESWLTVKLTVTVVRNPIGAARFTLGLIEELASLTEST